MSLSQFEHCVIRELLKGDVDETALLEQLGRCVVVDREHTGVGMFVNLFVLSDAPRAHPERDQPILGLNPRPYLIHPELEHGGSALLWLRDGSLSCLELVTCAHEDWPQSDARFTIEHQHVHDYRFT